MKFHWKLFLAFYLPLHFAFGAFYLSGLMQETPGNGKVGFSFHEENRGILSSADFFDIAGLGLTILSIMLPALILKRKISTKTLPIKFLD